MRGSLTLLLVASTAIGCYYKTDTDDSAKVPLGQMPAAAAAAPAAPAEGLTGKVVELLPASPYLYIRVKTSTGDVWAAVPETKLANGATVTVYSAMLMTKFASKTLKRTFDEVYFGTLTPPEAGAAGAMGGAMGGAADAAGAAGAAGASGTSPHTGAPAAAPVQVGKVEKATGADAKTVADAWAQKAGLAGKTVTIRGKVVKFNGAVMGKNWMHLQDGSGDATKGTNDITVTSMAEVKVGDLVTITGTVRTDKDFGAGYFYAIIVEDAKVVKN